MRRILDVKPDTRATVQQIRDHRWMKQIDYDPPSGIIVGRNQIPINFDILLELQNHGISLEKMKK